MALTWAVILAVVAMALATGMTLPTPDKQLVMNELEELIERLQRNIAPESDAYGPLNEVPEWPAKDLHMGQVAGLALYSDGNLLVLHRADRTWDDSTFNESNQYQHIEDGPIQEEVIVKIDSTTGDVIDKIGGNFFYMPHGITVDQNENIWVTDAALHQVFKIPSQEYEPALVLGEKFTPGNDASHFCKPTDVAVASNGVFFVADGYCNSRLMKFAPDGMLMEILDQGEFDTPHSLALIEEEDLICVADREHHSIRCFSAGLYNPKDVGVEKQTINDPRLGRVYAIDYANGNLYAVNGPEGDSPAHGFTIDVSTGEIKETWQPAEGFGSPHDVTASWTGTEVYVGDIGKNRPWKFQR